MFICKFFIFNENKYISSENLLRIYTNFTIPYNEFSVFTEDGVMIKGYHIENGHKELIIVCHGATRSKDILGNILFCEWLSSDFDIITFDFRGHHASSGTYSFDDKTVLDLRAIIDYSKTFNYNKIGIVGRSLGGWTAILYGSQYHDVNSIVSAASPIDDVYNISILANSPKHLFFFYKFISRILLEFRIDRNKSDLFPSNSIDKVSPIPLLLIYCETDPVAKTNIDEVNALFEKAKEPKSLIVYKGTGHILETKNVINYYIDTKNWFVKTLKN
jgi:pimeloyl-ACP methyl ester carboxylesterase